VGASVPLETHPKPSETAALFDKVQADWAETPPAGNPRKKHRIKAVLFLSRRPQCIDRSPATL